MKKLGTLMSIFSIQQLSAKPESIRIEEIPVISQSQFAQGNSYAEKILDLAQNQAQIRQAARLAISGSALVYISTSAYSCISSSDLDKVRELESAKITLSEEIKKAYGLREDFKNAKKTVNEECIKAFTKASNLGEELKSAKITLSEEMTKSSNRIEELKNAARTAKNTLSEKMNETSNRIEILRMKTKITKDALSEEMTKASDMIIDLKNAKNTLL